jgi:hypothetical protein
MHISGAFAKRLKKDYYNRMNTSTIATLLQLVVSLLSGAQHNVTMTPSTTEATVAIASRAVQLSAQVEAIPKIDFTIPPNDSNDPSMKDLLQAAYIDPTGTYVPAVGSDVNVVQGDTSFGDLNTDGFDDAVTIVQKTNSSGNTNFALAVMLNQGDMMFNIDDVPLGSSVEVFSHNIVQGGDLVLNMSVNGAAAQTSTYYLLGDQLLLKN